MEGKKRSGEKNDAFNKGKSIKLINFCSKKAVEEEERKRKAEKEAKKVETKMMERKTGKKGEEDKEKRSGNEANKEIEMEEQVISTDAEESEGSEGMEIEERAKDSGSKMKCMAMVKIGRHLRYVDDLNEKARVQAAQLFDRYKADHVGYKEVEATLISDEKTNSKEIK